MRAMMLTVAMIAVLAGCREEAAPDPVADSGGDAPRCGAEALQDLVGLPFDAGLLPGGNGPVRVIRPGMAVTRDYRLDRLNVHLDDSDVVTAIDCG